MNNTTSTLITKATKKPEGYELCFNFSCPLSDHCLRAQEAKKDDGTDLYISVVNPNLISRMTDGECPAFRDSNKTITYAIGFRQRMDSINHDTRRVYRELHSIFRNTHYYDMLNGNTLITPEEQAIIRRTAEKHGYPFPPDGFEVMVEGKVW